MYLVRYSRGHDCISRTKVFSRDICEEVPYLQARYLFPLKYVFDKELYIRSLMCLEITHTNCNDKPGNQWSKIFSTVLTQKKIFDFTLWFLIISNLPCNGPLLMVRLLSWYTIYPYTWFNPEAHCTSLFRLVDRTPWLKVPNWHNAYFMLLWKAFDQDFQTVPRTIEIFKNEIDPVFQLEMW